MHMAYFRMMTYSACLKHRLIKGFIYLVKEFQLSLQPLRSHGQLYCFVFKIPVLFFLITKVIQVHYKQFRVYKNIEKKIDISKLHHPEIIAFNILHIFFSHLFLCIHILLLTLLKVELLCMLF